MVAKDGEEMAMYGTCDCTGKVFHGLPFFPDSRRSDE